jgi:hypothetical protein
MMTMDHHSWVLLVNALHNTEIRGEHVLIQIDYLLLSRHTPIQLVSHGAVTATSAAAATTTATTAAVAAAGILAPFVTFKEAEKLQFAALEAEAHLLIAAWQPHTLRLCSRICPHIDSQQRRFKRQQYTQLVQCPA